MGDEIERTLLVKPEVLIYKIPPRPSARGYRAADWNLTQPDWVGRLRVSSKGKLCTIHLEDKSTGQLFAACPVEQYPGMSVEPVTDSSRYFVICVQDSGRKAYLGMGFADRSDSFDLNVALQDHFKWLRKEEGFSKEAEDPQKLNLDLAFKEGQTIRINIPKKDGSSSAAKSRPKTGGGILPPPPGGVKIGPPPGASNLTPMQSPTDPTKNVISAGSSSAPVSNTDLLGDLLGGGPSQAGPAPPASTASTDQGKDPFGDDPWGDFASAPAPTKATSGNWTSFE